VNLRGRFRSLKFRIGAHGNPAYDALKSQDGLSVTVLRETENWSFEECFRVVDFEEFGATRFDPDAFGGTDPRDEPSRED